MVVAVKEVLPEPEVKEPAAKANIEGRREAADVRKLLKTWINSTSDPTQDDIGTFGKFLQEMVGEREIETVSVILKSFRRFVHQTTSEEEIGAASWIVAYTEVEEQVQLSMLANYNYKMFTNFKIR